MLPNELLLIIESRIAVKAGVYDKAIVVMRYLSR